MTYLSTYTGSGTRDLRPAGVDQLTTYAVLDLCNGQCLVRVPDTTEAMRVMDANATGMEGDAVKTLACDAILGKVMPSLSQRVKEIWLGGGLLHCEPAIIAEPAPPIDPSDNFNRANGALGANWTKYTVQTGTITVVGNQAAETGGGASNTYGIYSHVTQAATADEFAQVTATYTAIATTKDIQVGLRALPSSTGPWPDGYATGVASSTGGSPGRYVFVYAGNAFISSFISTAGPAYVTGEILRVEASGSTIRGLLNGTDLAGSPTTNTSVSGAAGSRFFYITLQQGTTLDDFTAGDISAGQPTAKRFGGIPHMRLPRQHSIW